MGEDNQICFDDPERDFMMRLLRTEARDAQQEAATQALAMAVLGTTVAVSGNEVRFWSADGQPVHSPVTSTVASTAASAAKGSKGPYCLARPQRRSGGSAAGARGAAAGRAQPQGKTPAQWMQDLRHSKVEWDFYTKHTQARRTPPT